MDNKCAYPVYLHLEEEKNYTVLISDFGICTTGNSMFDSIFMARDAIGIMGITLMDEGKKLPIADSAKVDYGSEYIKTYVDIDFDEYRRMNDYRLVRRNCTLPNYLNELADRAGVNVSEVLREALKEKLGVS